MGRGGLEGRLHHSWPTELQGQSQAGAGTGGFPTSQKPSLWRDLSLASGVASWGRGCGWDSHSLAFPGTLQGPFPGSQHSSDSLGAAALSAPAKGLWVW